MFLCLKQKGQKSLFILNILITCDTKNKKLTKFASYLYLYYLLGDSQMLYILLTLHHQVRFYLLQSLYVAVSDQD